MLIIFVFAVYVFAVKRNIWYNYWFLGIPISFEFDLVLVFVYPCLSSHHFFRCTSFPPVSLCACCLTPVTPSPLLYISSGSKEVSFILFSQPFRFVESFLDRLSESSFSTLLSLSLSSPICLFFLSLSLLSHLCRSHSICLLLYLSHNLCISLPYFICLFLTPFASLLFLTPPDSFSSPIHGHVWRMWSNVTEDRSSVKVVMLVTLTDGCFGGGWILMVVMTDGSGNWGWWSWWQWWYWRW